MKKKTSTFFKKINNDNTNIIITILFIFVIIICCKVVINYLLKKSSYNIFIFSTFRSEKIIFDSGDAFTKNVNLYKKNKENMKIMLDDELIPLDTNKELLYNTLLNKNDYLNGIDIIYWINLDRATNRKIHMETIFKDNVFNNLRIERIEAFDGKNEDMKKYYSIYNNFNNNIHLNNKDYACLISHLNTIRLFSETTHKIALILEDDITLEYKEYWKEPVKNIIDSAPPNWEIIQLCLTLNIPDDYLNNNDNYILNKNEKLYCLAGYIINNKSAKKIKKFYKNKKFILNDKINHGADIYIFNIFKTYAYKNPYFSYLTKESTLHDDHLKFHIFSKQIITNYLKNN